MILFFSATGNCRYATSRLAQAFGQESISILDCIREGRTSFEDREIGIVVPTYFWGLPSIVKTFLEKASFRTEYLYFVATYGTTPGASGYMAGKALGKQQIDAYYSIRMVDTWTPVFDLSTPEKVKKYTKTTETDIDRIIRSVKERRKISRMHPRTPAVFTMLFAQPIYENRARCTSHLRVEAGCIGCGLCERSCPVQAIEIRNGKPVWVKEKCVMCLGCLHRCPKFAIQYDGKTRKHGQYTNPHAAG